MDQLQRQWRDSGFTAAASAHPRPVGDRRRQTSGRSSQSSVTISPPPPQSVSGSLAADAYEAAIVGERILGPLLGRDRGDIGARGTRCDRDDPTRCGTLTNKQRLQAGGRRYRLVHFPMDTRGVRKTDWCLATNVAIHWSSSVRDASAAGLIFESCLPTFG